MSQVEDKMTQYHVVLVEDDAVLRKMLAGYFHLHGYRVTEFDRILGVIEWLKKMNYDPLSRPDVLICDIELPDGSGLDLMSKLHVFPRLGKILISQRKETQDRIAGLRLGADDYLGKPLSPEELLLRTKNLIQRLLREKGELGTCEHISFGQSLIHPETRLLNYRQRRVVLTEGELQLLLQLIARQGKVISREALALALGNENLNLSSRSIDVLVGRLRKKLEAEIQAPESIVTFRGKGYMLVCS